MELEKLALPILRFALAKQAFLEADAIAEHILSTRIDPQSPLYYAAVAGMSASYVRPFTENTGLGSLSSLEKFPRDNPDFEQLHIRLKEQRNKLGSHFDLSHLKAQFQKGTLALHPGEVEITLLPNGFGTRTNHTTTSLEAIGQLRKLFGYQLERLDAELGKLCGAIAREKGLGTIVFSP
jgi:hypothetical protein